MTKFTNLFVQNAKCKLCIVQFNQNISPSGWGPQLRGRSPPQVFLHSEKGKICVGVTVTPKCFLLFEFENHVPLMIPFRCLLTKHVWDKCIFPFSIQRDVLLISWQIMFERNDLFSLFTQREISPLICWQPAFDTILLYANFTQEFFLELSNYFLTNVFLFVLQRPQKLSFRRRRFCDNKIFFFHFPYERVFATTKNIRFLHWAISKHISQQMNWIIVITMFPWKIKCVLLTKCI